MKGLKSVLAFLFIVLFCCGLVNAADDITPPASSVKLIFIHHSTGQNWLSDSDGGLGIALRDNNYFVSDTNYDWGTDSIGSTTDIGHWYNWFRGSGSSTYMSEVYTEYGQHCEYSRLASDPGGENEIVMFKSCFPNSALRGPSVPIPSIDSNPLRGEDVYSDNHTVANAKGIYIDLLNYFAVRQDKLFIVITAPPLSDPTYAGNARIFNEWLINDWLDSYPHNNVFVFDFYNVLTTNGGNNNTNDLGSVSGNHHRWYSGAIQHIITGDNDPNPNVLEYRSGAGDDHPSRAGNLKATAEFLPLLNIAYNRWKDSDNHAPIADMGIIYKSAYAGNSTTFSGAWSSDPDGDAITYSWNFGDGTTGAGISISHSYAGPGIYTATLTVTDSGGLSSSDTVAVTVFSLPGVAGVWPGYSGVDIGALVRSGYFPGFEPSDIIWHPVRNSLFVVGDGGQLVEMDSNGNVLHTWTPGGDLEGIAIANASSNLIYLGIEHPDSIVEFNVTTGTPTGRSWNLTSWMTGVDNAGLEALTFVPNGSHPYIASASGGLFYAGLQETGDIYVFDVNLDSIAGVSCIGKIDHVPGRNDISGMHFDSATSKIYAIYDSANILHEMQTNGAILNIYNLPGFDQEGIAIRHVDRGNIFIAEDSGRMMKYTGYPNINDAPVLNPIGARSVNEGSALNILLTASDPDGGMLTYSATEMPGGARLVSNMFDWVPDYTQAGTYSVTFTVSDGSLSDSETVIITVNDVDSTAPVISGVSIHDITHNTATVSFNTDESATDVINYGVTGMYGMSVTDSVLSLTHDVVLSGLLPHTTYHFQIQASDASGNTASTGDIIFATTRNPDDSTQISLAAADWFIYASSGTITNEFDPELGLEKLISGTSKGVGFGIAYTGSDNFRGDCLNISGKTKLSVLLKTIEPFLAYVEPFVIYVRVRGTDGRDYYLTYTRSVGADTDIYKRFAVGEINNGTWQLIVRDLDEDLFKKTAAHISIIKWFCIRGNLEIGEILLQNELPSTLEIDTPTDSEEVSGLSTIVSGVIGAGVTGVNVNGFSAEISGDRFVVSSLPLANGENTITAVGYSSDGVKKTAQGMDTVNVTSTIDGVSSVLIPLENWFVYAPVGEILNEIDPELGHVVLNTVTTERTGFGIAYTGSYNFGGDCLRITGKTNLSVQLKTTEPFVIYVRVRATDGRDYYLMYARSVGADTDNYKCFAVGAINDGTWRVLTRDLDADLNERIEEEVHIQYIKWFCVRGRLSIGEIVLSE